MKQVKPIELKRALNWGGLTISRGNSKVGNVMSVSLPPGVTCPPGVPCYKDCYARRLSKIRPTVARSWERNWRVCQADLRTYFHSISRALHAFKPRLWRWHVAGDFPSAAYYLRTISLAYGFPNTHFMAFTKQFDFVRATPPQDLPENYSVVLSGWPGRPVPEDLIDHYPTVWMYDPQNPDPNIPVRYVECAGQCDQCLICWDAKPGTNVRINKH